MMLKVFCSVLVFSATLSIAQDQTRISQPIVPKGSTVLFGPATKTKAKAVEKESVTAKGKTENKGSGTTVEQVTEDPVLVDLPALGPLPGASEIPDALTLFNQLPPLPESSPASQPLKKKVNGKWVITSTRDSSTQFKVREVNGRKVIYPK